MSASAGDAGPGDRLRSIFTCCHPALSQDVQVAMTLRQVCGLRTADIARLFLVAEPVIADVLTRAGKAIEAAGDGHRVPWGSELPDRLPAALAVIHQLYTTGHTAPSGNRLVRGELVDSAVELARVLHASMPDEPEVRGLLALLLLTDARRATRTDAAGRPLPLEEQDRSRWDRAAIEEGTALVSGVRRGAGSGRYVLQAVIASLHAGAPSVAETDWPRILACYDELLGTWPSPVVALNRAVAVSMVDGPAAALDEIESLERGGLLAGYRYLPAAKADLLRRLSRRPEAVAAYRDALDLAGNDAERAFLSARIAELARD